MKYCISNHHNDTILAKADIIYVIEPEHNQILQFIEHFPEKTIILEISDNSIELATLEMYREKIKNFILSFSSVDLMDQYINLGFASYWKFTVHSFSELNSIIQHKPCQINIGEPLTFNLEKIKKITNIKLSLIPNLAQEPYLLKTDGICGPWVRPDDIPKYEKYIDNMSFYGTPKEEEILLEIYKKGIWFGNLNLLIKYLNVNIDNRQISDGLITKRLNCGQKCMENNLCHACESEFRIANLIRKLHESTIRPTNN